MCSKEQMENYILRCFLENIGVMVQMKTKTPEAAKHVNTNVLTLNWGLFCCDITWGVPHQGLNAFFI